MKNNNLIKMIFLLFLLVGVVQGKGFSLSTLDSGGKKQESQNNEEVLNFLRQNNLIHLEVNNLSSEINIRKDFAASCKLNATTCYSSAPFNDQTTCENQVGPSGWFPDTNDCTSAADTTAPTLSSVSSANVAETTADIKATSNEAGTMYYVIATSSSSPTYSQVANNTVTNSVKSGNSPVSDSSAKTFFVTGLTAGTQYYYYVVAKDTSNNESSISSGNFTTSVTTPSLTSTSYNASAGTLVVTGTNFEAKSGASNDVTANKFTFTGEGGSTYTLTDTPDVEITSATEFTLVLSATDKAAVNQILNKNGTSSTSGTTYNISAADDYMANVTSDDTSSATNALTVSSIPTPTITSATYDATTGSLILTGTNFVKKSGATNDIDVTKLTLLGQDNNSYTLTSSSVEITNSTSATISLNATDKLNVNGILNKNGTTAVSGTTYNLSGAEDWMAGYTGTDADTSNNSVTVSNVSTPTITSATYDATTGVLSVTGTNLVKKSGATNDIAVSSLTLTGEGSTTRTLTTLDVEITSATNFSITLNSSDKSAVNLILNNNGTSSTDGTTYNLSASDDWNTVIGNTNISDLSNGITVSNVSNPTITSSTYYAKTGTLLVKGTNFVSNAGATNDIDITKLTILGEGSNTYTLTSSNVEVTNDTSFSVILNETDHLNINGILNKDGTSSGDGITYNLSVADDWMQGSLASNDISDTTGNGIIVNDVSAPKIISATYDVSSGVLDVTGINFVKKSGALNDVDISKLTLTGEGSATETLTTTNVEISSTTRFTVTLNQTDKTAVNSILNRNGLASKDNVTYNLAVADDWMPAFDSSVNIEDLTYNKIAVSSATNNAPTISSTAVTSIDEDTAYSYTLSGNDIDGDELTWKLKDGTSLPSWLSLSYSPGGNVSTFAGNGLAGTKDGTGTKASFNGPQALIIDSNDTLYSTGFDSHKIRKITSFGVVTTYGGTGQSGSLDGSLLNATFNRPQGIAVDSKNNIFIADQGGHIIRKITPSGDVTTFVGKGVIGDSDGTGTTIAFNNPSSIAIDSNDNLFVADTKNHKIRKITPDGRSSTFAGLGVIGSSDDIGIASTFNTPYGIDIDSNDNLYVADTNNHKIRKITPSGNVTTLAGSGSAGFADGTGSLATFRYPDKLVVDSDNNIYVGDYNNHSIRKITPAGVVTTIAGNGSAGLTDAFGKLAQFNGPTDIAIDSKNNIYIADQKNHKIRKIKPKITLVGTPTNSDVGSHNISFVLTDGTNEIEHNFTITVNPVNDAPTNISLSGSSVAHSSGANAVVGTLSSVDIDDNSFTYALVSKGTSANGSCSSDTANSSFEISSNSLKAKNPTLLSEGNHNICIQTNDGDITFEKMFTVAVDDDVSPTANLSSLADNIGSIIGSLLSGSTTDDSSLVLSGTNEAGSTVKVYNGSSLIGNATVTGTTWTYTATIADGTTYQFNIKETDTAGNESTNSTTTTITGDMTAPTVQIAIDKTALKANETATVTFTLSEASSNFVEADISVSGGTLSNFTNTSSKVYTAKYTPNLNSTSSGAITVNASKFTDSAGNNNTAALQKTVTVDTIIPTLSVSSSKNTAINGEVIDLTFTLSEESSDFTVDDISVVGGSLSEFTQSTSNAKAYTAKFTIDNTTTTQATVDVNQDVLTDSAGNTNSAAAQKVITIFPSVVKLTPPKDSTQAALNSDLKIEFSEEVVKGTTGSINIYKTSDDGLVETIDINDSKITIENPNSTNGLTNTTVTIAKATQLDLVTGYYVTISNTAFKDVNGNLFEGISNKTTWAFTTIDNQAPTISNNSSNATATISVDENQTAVVDVDATDPDSGQTLTYSISGTDASFFDIDSTTGVITFKTAPDYETKSSYSVTVKASDDSTVSLSDTQALTVNINDVNEAPTSSNNSFTINEDTTKTFASTDFAFSDVDNANTLNSIKIVTLPSKGSLQLNSSDVVVNQSILKADISKLTYTPVANENGSFYSSFTFKVNDGNLDSTSAYTMTVNVTAVDDAPEITTTLDNQTQVEDGEGLVISLATSDIDSDASTATYTVTSSDENIAKAYIRDGKLIVVPQKNATGTVTITLTSKVAGKSTTKTFTYSLTGVNDAPIISSIGDISHKSKPTIIDETITFDIWDDVEITSLTAASSNENLLSNFTIPTAPYGNQSTFNYKIDANNAGITTVTITAKDVEGLEYKESFKITVEQEDTALCVENVKTALTFDTIKLNNSFQNAIDSNLNLITNMNSICSAIISWESTDSTVIDASGAVTKGSDDKTIMLTANISKDEFSSKKEFLLTVISSSVSNTVALDKLTFETIKEENSYRSAIASKLNLPTSILGEDIIWTSSDDSVISPYSGYVTRNTTEDKEVTLTATIGNETKIFALTVLKEEASDANSVNKDKELLTLSSILGDNTDKNSIIYNLFKPLPSSGANGSTISWSSSNESYLTNEGDVLRDANANKTVVLTATITKGNETVTKEFTFQVMQNKIETETSNEFKNAGETTDGTQVTTTSSGVDTQTKSSFDSSILNTVESIVSQGSIKSIVEVAQKIVNVYLNTDGTTKSTLQTSTGLASLENKNVGSTTNVEDDGDIVSSNSDDTIRLKLNNDGSVTHEVVNNTVSKTSTATSSVEGSSVKSDKDGNVETTSEVKKDGFIYKAVVTTNKEGQTMTKFVRVDLSSGEQNNIDNTVSPNTPFQAGNEVEISEIDGSLYIKTTTPLDGSLEIE
ncbi:immunoglobulin-like domain-containing protein [Arcobacter sp. YIC-310]|uniref:immunoglobulin-like domain-containing protein n=1 Tax=Arcobacter sp. YIC-310 TaxID=3376632 RepID=UPI003C1C8613